MYNMENVIKVIISGLDNAGKTSILTALDKKYDFRDEIMQLKPTIKVKYRRTRFLNMPAVFWDMGGQEKYRNVYLKDPDVYFSETSLFIYVIDIQDSEKLEASLNYFEMVMKYFIENNIDVPVIITFHKYDPDIRSYEEINEDIAHIRENIKEAYSDFNILFQQTSIYDVISIVQLVSYGLSVFDKKFFELSLLIEKSLNDFNCTSLILFDQTGIIISEFYNEEIEPGMYIYLLESIKEHLFLLKRMEEEEYKHEHDFLNIEKEFISCLHGFEVKGTLFFISAILKEEYKDAFMEKFSDFLKELQDILKLLLE